jgi:RNA-directed DNA polymerase
VAYAQRLVDQGVPVFFSPLHLAWTVGVPFNDLTAEAADPHYRTFLVPKRRGGHRRIAAPGPLLKHVQGQIHQTVTSRMPISDFAHGFVPKRSIMSNAAPHVGQRVVAKFDIEDFFGSVGRERVASLFTTLGYAPSVVDVLTDLCTKDGGLPQGAPTSPSLANAVSLDMDRELQALAAEHQLAYTRYADDLTISGRRAGSAHIHEELTRIVHRHGFRLNEPKTAVLTQATRQRVTGIVVNERANWPRDLRRWLRREIHYLERFGVDGHLRHQAERAHAAGRRTRANYRDFIYGHTYALHSACPEEAIGYLQRLDAINWPGVPRQDAA